MNWHWVLHTPSTASTQDRLSSLHYHDYQLTPESSFRFRRVSIHHWSPSARSRWPLKGKLTLLHSHGCESTNCCIGFQHPEHRPSTASKYLSNLTRSRPVSVSPNSLHYGLQVRTIMASKCISTLARLWPPSLHHHSLQVHLHLARLRPPNSLHHGLKVCLITRSITPSKFTWSWPPSASPNSLDHDPGVHLNVHSIMASKCISEYTGLLPPSASPNSLDHSHGVYRWVHLIVIIRHTSNCSQVPHTATPDIPCVEWELLGSYIDI